VSSKVEFGQNEIVIMINLGAISHTTKTSQSSHPITSPPSTSTSTSSLLNWCSGANEIWVNCGKSALGWDANGWEGTAVGFFDPNNPYNTKSYPDNIVPANPSVASYCGSLWSSSARLFGRPIQLQIGN
jgi:hypothetical protein